MSDEIEEWREVPYLRDIDVSDWGRVRSWRDVAFTFGHSGAIPIRASSPRLLSQAHRPDGYRTINVWDKERGYARSCRVHTLILETFVGPRPKGMKALHDPDPDRSNNRLSNLRWGTTSDNMRDAIRHDPSRFYVIDEAQVPDIWSRLVAGESGKAIARSLNVNPSVIWRIRRGQSFSHITSKMPGWPLVSESIPVYSEPIRAPQEILDSATELWVPAPDWPAYDISTQGNVLSYWRICRRKNFVDRSLDGRPKTVNYNKRTGYLCLWLTNENGIYKHKNIHQLVLSSFAGPQPRGMVACHCDGDRLNNRIANLRWDTPSGNARDMVKHGTSPNMVLSPDDIGEICDLLSSGLSQKAVARMKGVSSATIGRIDRNRSQDLG